MVGLYAVRRTLYAHRMRLPPSGILLLLVLSACRGETRGSLGKIVEAQSLGAMYLDANRLPQAEAQFKRLIDLAPDDVAGYTRLGVVYIRMGRAADAERQIREAVKRDSTN